MEKIIPRGRDKKIVHQLMSVFPVVAILGPRQCGKTVISKMIRHDHYFDLENYRDLAQFENPQLTLESLTGTIVIDEIQRRPDLFPLLRYLVDSNKKQKYLILGSASEDLIKQSSESLAGRIGFHYLTGFSLWDIGYDKWRKLWLRGGYPRAFLSRSNQDSFLWLENYIKTFLERDIPQLGIRIPSNVLHRFWTMISHYHGQTANFSEIGRSFGITDITARSYLAILEKTFMIRIIQPWYVNIKKRLIKHPKLYISDTGILHSLQTIESIAQLNSNPKAGASWEGFALECIATSIDKKVQNLYFWGTHSGAELDLFWQHKGKNWGIEFKYADAPTITKSMRSAISDLQLSRLWVIYPGKDQYPLDKKIEVMPLIKIPIEWKY